jgi:beta-glucanase (GH16 family)
MTFFFSPRGRWPSTFGLVLVGTVPGLVAGCGSKTNALPQSEATDATVDAFVGDASAETEAQDGESDDSASLDAAVLDSDAADGAAADALPTDAGGGWHLTWSDEFDGPAGSQPEKWNWLDSPSNINHELEYYTARPDNVRLDGNGNLLIVAQSESYMGRDYTSGRIDTQGGLFDQTYGRFEARIKLPTSKGVWPAFFMFGTNIDDVGWPECGEIDIMENRGSEPTINYGSLHGPGFSGASALTAAYVLPGGAKYADDFHLFAVEWEVDVVRFYVDDKLYQTRRMSDFRAPMMWAFDHPMYIILDVAVGGSFPGNPDMTTVLPQTMTVDYVRVYAR